MASKRNQRRRGCTNKVRHETAEIAEKVLKKTRRNHPNRDLHFYKCNNCGGYHVGGYNRMKTMGRIGAA